MIKRILKWTFRFSALALLILVVLTTYSWYGYRQAQADFRALGYPTTMEELRAWDAIDDSALNAVIPIQQAMDKMTWDFPEDLQLPISSDCCWRNDYDGAYPPEILTDIKIMLDANHKSLQILHDSRHLEKYRPEITNRSIEFEYVEDNSNYSSSAFFLVEEAHYFAGIQDMDAAIDSFETVLWLSEMLSQYPSNMDMFTANFIRDMGLRLSRNLLERYDLDDEQIDRLIASLESAEANLGFRRNAAGDIVMHNDYLSIENQIRSIRELAESPPYLNILVESDTYDLLWGNANGSFWRAKRDNLRITIDFLQMLNSESLNTIPEFEYLRDDHNWRDGISMFATPWLILMPTPFTQRAEFSVNITGLRIEQYRRKHGVLPETLEDLVPEFTESIPMDAMTGEALVYTITEDGYEVYSLGQNLEDDHGTLDQEGDPKHERIEFQRVLN